MTHMKHVVILESSLSNFPWLETVMEQYSKFFTHFPDTQFHLFCEVGLSQAFAHALRGFATVHEYKDFRTNKLVETELLRFAKDQGIDLIVAPREFDLIRAARAREFLQIKGQSLESALAFRDKLLMKKCCEIGGIPTIKYHQVDYAIDLEEAREVLGFPFVVKPRRLAMEMGFQLLRNECELNAYVASIPHDIKTHDQSLDLIAETCVRMSQWHVDGYLYQGNVIFCTSSRYTGPENIDEPPFDDWEPSGSLMHHPEDAIALEMRGFVERLFKVFPSPTHCVFHIEIWRDVAGNLFLGEAACRAGGAGGMVHEMLWQSSGVSPDIALLNFELSQPPLDAYMPKFKQCLRAIRVPWKEGTVTKLPKQIDLPFVTYYKTSVSEGQSLPKQSQWFESLAELIAHGDDHMAAEARGFQAIQAVRDCIAQDTDEQDPRMVP